jgi:hypothetical protein
MIAAQSKGREGLSMKRTLIALAAAGLVAAAIPNTAQARCHGCGVAAGVVGGLAAGAIIGSAIAGSRPTYVEPAPVYGPPPPAYYVEPADVEPECHTVRRRVFIDGVGYRWTREDVCD